MSVVIFDPLSGVCPHMRADTPADEPQGEAPPAEEEEEPIVYDGPLPADIAEQCLKVLRDSHAGQYASSHGHMS